MTLFPAQTTTLSSAAFAARLLPAYSFGQHASCLFLHKGLNDTYIVHARRQTYYLRVYRAGWRTRAEIDAELELLNYLHRRGVPVARPVKRRDRQYIADLDAPEGVRPAVLFTAAPGAQHVPMSPRQSGLFGHTAALIHQQADRQRKTYARYEIDLAHLSTQPLAALRPFFSARPRDFAYLARVADACTVALSSLPRTAPAFGLCHGDLHAGNVHFGPHPQLTLFDFDLCGYGWRAYDLAVFLWSRLIGHPRPEAKRSRVRAWQSFLRAYERVRPLSQQERAAIPRFVALRHIWLLGLHADMINIWGSLWFNEQYFARELRTMKAIVREYRLLQ